MALYEDLDNLCLARLPPSGSSPLGQSKNSHLCYANAAGMVLLQKVVSLTSLALHQAASIFVCV